MPASLTAVGGVTFQNNLFVAVSASAPERDVYAPSPDPCEGTLFFRRVPLPDDFVMTTTELGWLNSLSLLMPDGSTLEEFSAAQRCQPAAPLYGFPYATEDIYGLGLHGGQGGSGISALGGTLRREDFTHAGPIRHALKIFVWGDRHLFYDAAAPERCFRWPATRCDAGASAEDTSGYHGTNPSFVQGTLLAIPPEYTEYQLGLESAPGRKFFTALQDYGAYVVGNSNSDTVLLPTFAEARRAFETTYGRPLESYDVYDPWLADLNKILPVLHIVDNNAPESVGGGGTPRRALAPPIAD
jgi:hypothetical protein